MNALPPDEGAERTLDGFVPGESGIVSRLEGDPAIARRLMELGLVPGTSVQMIRRAPLGDPLELATRGMHLSLRRSEARLIHVSPC